jgi:hypothetical protein
MLPARALAEPTLGEAPPSNKEQTPLGDLLDPNPRFHGGCFGVLGHTSWKALQL